MISLARRLPFFVIFFVIFGYSKLSSYYGYLPDNMLFYDAISVRAHDAQSVSGLGWNIPNHYGSFYDLMKLYGARNIDLRVYLGTDEVAALAPLHDVGNFFDNLFSGKPLDKPREKPRALITCHEHDEYYKNCWFTRLVMKNGIPTKIDYFFQEAERFLRNNPREFLIITFEMYLDARQGNDVNGWTGKTQSEVNAFLDAIIERSGLSKRLVGIPGPNTTMRELRGKVIFFGNLPEVVKGSKYVKHMTEELFETEGWGQFPQALEKGICPVYYPKQKASLFEANIIPTNPFDSGIPVDAINAFLKFVTQDKDFTIYNFKTQVNTEQNIRNMIKICQKMNKKPVNAISMDFISKGTPKIPASIIFDINKERLEAKGMHPQYSSYEAYIATLK